MTREIEQRNPIEVLSEIFLDRLRCGETLTIGQFAEEHPEHSETIRRLFPAILALETCKSSRLSTKSTGRPLEVQIETCQQLGDFRIVAEIARGGMGVVYEAVQQSLQRRVAVKVFPRQALPDSKHLDRFHREAKTAARLHHTNIVPVFGVGKQDDLHYYVMQRIEGISLEEVIQRCSQPRQAIVQQSPEGDTIRSLRAADRTEISTGSEDASGSFSRTENAASYALTDRFRSPSERLHEVPCSCEHWLVLVRNGGQPLWNAIASVGIQVADALDYAHAQGVLHRDIKPSNLLLDQQGTVWVTDFGLATALESEQGAHPEEVAGTLRFMAPEHISGVQDARSDLYSLGLTLYELMTLKPAFHDSSRTLMLSKILKGTVTPPRELRPEIPKDLEAIVLRAMARNSAERYASAAELASDLRRFVEGRPVAARPLSPPLQLWRWTTRNPVVAMLAMALLLTGVTSFFVIGSKWKDAVAENQRAEDNLTIALESLDQVLEHFTSSWMAHPMAAESNGRELGTDELEMQMAVSNHSAAVLQETLQFYDRFAKQNPTSPQLFRETAKVHRRVADIYQRLGQHRLAEEAYRRSLAFWNTPHLSRDPSLDLERIETINQLGFSMYSASRFGDAEQEFRRALDLVASSSQGMSPEGRAYEAGTRTNLAQCLALMFRGEEAQQSQQQAIEILEGLVQEAPENAKSRLELARAYRNQYWLVGFSRRSDVQEVAREREVIRDAAVRILDGLIGEYPSVPDYRCELSELIVTTHGRHAIETRHSAELERAVTFARELADSYPSIPRYRAVLARALLRLADVQCESKLAETDAMFDEAIGLLRSLTHNFPDMPIYRVFLVHALREQAETFARLERFDEACAVMEMAIDEQERHARSRPEQPTGRGKGLTEHLKRRLDWMRIAQEVMGDSPVRLSPLSTEP